MAAQFFAFAAFFADVLDGASTVPPPPEAPSSPGSGSGGGQESARPRRQRRHFVRIERLHEPRRDQHHQLGALGAVRLALEQVADDRQLAQDGDLGAVFLRQVVEQPGDHERLAVAQLDVGFRAPDGERGNAETRQGDAVAEVERAHLGLHLQADHVAGNRRLEREANPELLVLNGDGAGRALNDGNGNLAAGKKAGLLVVVRDEVRLGEALEEPVRFQRLDDRADALRALRRRTGSGNR